MPELPEVETVRQSLDASLSGLAIDRVQMFRVNLRYPFPQGFAEKLQGCRMVRVYRWAKYLLLELITPAHSTVYWLIHLGMSGQCRLVDQETLPEKHDHLQVDFSDGIRLHYRDPRRFGFMEYLKDLKDYAPFAKMGREAILCTGTHPEAAARGVADGDYLLARLRGRNTPIKSALLDQQIIAGLGNIYINEALWSIGVHPQTRARHLPTQLYPALAEAIHDTLRRALKSGGSSLRDFVHTDGKLGYFQHAWQAYGQAGTLCKKAGCSGIIQQEMQQGRSAFFCPVHQTLFHS